MIFKNEYDCWNNCGVFDKPEKGAMQKERERFNLEMAKALEYVNAWFSSSAVDQMTNSDILAVYQYKLKPTPDYYYLE